MINVENKRIAYQGKFKIAQYDVTDTEKNHSYVAECFERGDSVAALVFDSDNQTFLFTEQFRIGSQSKMVEVVAGSMDKDGEEPIETLKRELMEEMGVEIAPAEENGYPHYQSVGHFYVSPGGTSEKIHLFVVDKIVRKSNGGGVEDENINVLELDTQEMQQYFVEGKFTDLKTAFLLQIFMSAIERGEG